MPLDPDISLQAGAGLGAAGGPNPLQFYQGVMGIQNLQQQMQSRALEIQKQQLEVQQFQASFGARQKLGTVINGIPQGTPDWFGEVSRRAMADPEISPWAGTLMNELRQWNQTEAQIGLTRLQQQEAAARIGQIGQETAKTGLANAETVEKGVLRTIGAGITDPDLVNPALNAHIQNFVPPQYQDQARTFAHSLVGSLVPQGADPAKRESWTPEQVGTWQRNVAGVGTATGSIAPADAWAAGNVPAPSITEVPTRDDLGRPTTQFENLGGFGPGTVRSGMAGGAQEGGGVPPGPPGPPGPGSRALAPPGPSPQEKEVSQRLGEEEVKLKAELSRDAGLAPKGISIVDRMLDTIAKGKGFQAGGGASAERTVLELNQGLNRMGFHIPIIEDYAKAHGNEKLQNNQVFNAMAASYVTGQLREASEGTGAGRIKPEVEAFLRSLGENTDPNAIVELLNQQKKQWGIAQDRLAGFDEFQGLLKKRDPSVKGMDALSYNRWFNENRGVTDRLRPTPQSSVEQAPGREGEAKPVVPDWAKDSKTGYIDPITRKYVPPPRN